MRRLSSGNTALLREFPFAAGPSHRVESAQLNAVPSLATLFVTPSSRAQFVSHAPASPWLSAGLGYGLYEGSSVLQNGVANTEISSDRGDSPIQRGNRRPHPAQTAVPDRLQRRVSGLLHVRETRVSAFRSSAQTSIISSSREDWLSTFSRPRRGHPLVNMEDRMLDRFADHQS
jgi:hypothetical protein